MIAIGDIVLYKYKKNILAEKYTVVDIDNINMVACISQPDTNNICWDRKWIDIKNLTRCKNEL